MHSSHLVLSLLRATCLPLSFRFSTLPDVVWPTRNSAQFIRVKFLWKSSSCVRPREATSAAVKNTWPTRWWRVCQCRLSPFRDWKLLNFHPGIPAATRFWAISGRRPGICRRSTKSKKQKAKKWLNSQKLGMRQSKRSCVASTWNATQRERRVSGLDICGSYEWHGQADLSSPEGGWEGKFRKQQPPASRQQAARAVGKVASQRQKPLAS